MQFDILSQFNLFISFKDGILAVIVSLGRKGVLNAALYLALVNVELRLILHRLLMFVVKPI